MKVIGIDIGTTSICGVVLDADNGAVLTSQTEMSDAFINTENTWEKIQDPAKIITIAKNILDGFLEEYKDEVLAIGITGQMHGIVYVDENGDAVSPLYTWQDARGNLPYMGTTYAKFLGSFSGYGNVTDFYNKENGLVPEAACTYCTIHDYFGMKICGNRSPVLHASDAASLGLYNASNKSFDYDYNVKVTDGFDIIGTYHGISVSVAIGDNQASVFATLSNENDLLINVGTGSQISIVSDRSIIAENIESRPYVGGKYLIVGSALCGGRAYSILKDFYKKLFESAGIKDIDVYRLMDKMTEGADGTTLIVDTRFDGTRSNANIRGSIENISIDNFKPKDLTVGVIQGMVDELYDMYAAMGQKRIGIVGSGNGIRKNKALIYAAEKTFGGCLKVPAYKEEAACGAALFALVACDGRDVADVQKLIRYEGD